MTADDQNLHGIRAGRCRRCGEHSALPAAPDRPVPLCFDCYCTLLAGYGASVLPQLQVISDDHP